MRFIVFLSLIGLLSGIILAQDDTTVIVAMNQTEQPLYSDPDENSAVVGNLSPQTGLTVMNRTGNRQWVQVQTPDDLSGWINADALENSINIAKLSVHPVYTVACDVSQFITMPPRTRYIFREGQQRGNRALVFAKVGDSITLARYFLKPIGEDYYALHDCSYLQETITAFSQEHTRTNNSFATISLASNNGWSGVMALNPLRNDYDACHSWESVIDCEYRLLNPSIALIMFGTNDVGALPLADFRSAMREIIMQTLNRGIIPVLSTIPPRPEFDNLVLRFNDTIRSLAHEYNVPLMDYWQALMQIPENGLSSDGVHPTVPPGGYRACADFNVENLKYGFVVRNLLTLHMLERLYREVILPEQTQTQSVNS